MIRQERAADRARATHDRESQRRRIEHEREASKRLKQEAKEATLAEWRLELEEHQERERAIDSVGNDSPEVEDRDNLYAELLRPRTFEAEPFVAPPMPSAELKRIRAHALSTLDDRAAVFRPVLQPFHIAQLVVAIVFVASAAWLALDQDSLATHAAPAAFVMFLGIESIRRRARAKQKSAFDAQVLGELESEIQHATRQYVHDEEVAARASYESAVARAADSFEEEETARIAEIQALLAGDLAVISAVAESLLPIDLPIECEADVAVNSATSMTVNVCVPAESALPAQDAKLLASGRVSYKAKTAKKIREQYTRFVGGVALRYASELMLHVPTCMLVHVSVHRKEPDRSTGQQIENRLLSVKYDYGTLAPMNMDDIDPVEALRHFDQEPAAEVTDSKRGGKRTARA